MKTQFKGERPEVDPIDELDFVLEQLHADNSVDVTDGITWYANVTDEELIGDLSVLVQQQTELVRRFAPNDTRPFPSQIVAMRNR